MAVSPGYPQGATRSERRCSRPPALCDDAGDHGSGDSADPLHDRGRRRRYHPVRAVRDLRHRATLAARRQRPRRPVRLSFGTSWHDRHRAIAVEGDVAGGRSRNPGAAISRLPANRHAAAAVESRNQKGSRQDRRLRSRRPMSRQPGARHATNMNASEGSKMRDQFSHAQQVRKPAAISRGGIIAAQSRKAAEIGAEVLAAGGDCVDAVVATSFALSVLEPWNSGIGGGGAMVLYRAREDRYEVIDFGMRAPGSLRVEDYPLMGDGAASDIFPWPRVKDDRNLHGPGSIAVPGVGAGMEEAHRLHAKLPWHEMAAPRANH